MLKLFYASIKKKDGEMMKKSSSCTSINSQVRNVIEYNYYAGPNVLNTYQNNMATFPQNLMPNISNNCTVNFHFYSKWERIHWLENYVCNSQNIEANMW